MTNHQFQKIKNIIEAIIRIKGGRGYSAGKVIPNNSPKPGLGKSEYEYEHQKEDTNSLDPVEVSRAYKKEEKND